MGPQWSFVVSSKKVLVKRGCNVLYNVTSSTIDHIMLALSKCSEPDGASLMYLPQDRECCCHTLSISAKQWKVRGLGNIINCNEVTDTE